MILLTDKQVAEQLQLKSPRTVAKLAIPVVRIGVGKGVRRYRQEDVDGYINLRVQYQGVSDGKEAMKAKRDRVQSKPGPLGLQGLPSRAHLQAIRMGNAGRCQGGAQ